MVGFLIPGHSLYTTVQQHTFSFNYQENIIFGTHYNIIQLLLQIYVLHCGLGTNK